MTDTAAIIERLRKATGADHKLNEALHSHLGYCLHPKKERSGAQSDTGFTCVTCGADSWGNKGLKGERLYGDTPLYTASLDAALTLVPEGAAWSTGVRHGAHAMIETFEPPFLVKVGHNERVATPAIALCIAGLLARQAREGAGDA